MCAREELAVAKFGERAGEIALVGQFARRDARRFGAEGPRLLIGIPRRPFAPALPAARIHPKLTHALVAGRQVALESNLVSCFGGKQLQLMLHLRDD